MRTDGKGGASSDYGWGTSAVGVNRASDPRDHPFPRGTRIVIGLSNSQHLLQPHTHYRWAWGPSPAEGHLWSHTSHGWPNSTASPNVCDVPTTCPTGGGGPAGGQLPGPGGPSRWALRKEPAQVEAACCSRRRHLLPQCSSAVPAHTLLGSSGALVHLIYLTFGKLSPWGSAPVSPAHVSSPPPAPRLHTQHSLPSRAVPTFVPSEQNTPAQLSPLCPLALSSQRPYLSPAPLTV